MKDSQKAQRSQPNYYRSGRAFENRVIRDFKTNDPETVIVVPSAGSQGPADLVVLRSSNPRVLLVQVKKVVIPGQGDIAV